MRAKRKARHSRRSPSLQLQLHDSWPHKHKAQTHKRIQSQYSVQSKTRRAAALVLDRWRSQTNTITSTNHKPTRQLPYCGIQQTQPLSPAISPNHIHPTGKQETTSRLCIRCKHCRVPAPIDLSSRHVSLFLSLLSIQFSIVHSPFSVLHFPSPSSSLPVPPRTANHPGLKGLKGA